MINLEERDIFTSVVLQRMRDEVELPHPMLCFDHGGGSRNVFHNAHHGFTCPKCGHHVAESFGAGSNDFTHFSQEEDSDSNCL